MKKGCPIYIRQPLAPLGGPLSNQLMSDLKEIYQLKPFIEPKPGKELKGGKRP